MQVCVSRSFSVHLKADMKRYGVELIEIGKAQEISPGLYSTGDLEGTTREQAALLQTPFGNFLESRRFYKRHGFLKTLGKYLDNVEQQSRFFFSDDFH